jgi:hypothetical protein
MARISWTRGYEPRLGDIILWGRVEGIVSDVIAWHTASRWSHAGMIVGRGETPLFDHLVCCEVVNPVREQRLCDYGDRECWILRPLLDEDEHEPTIGQGELVAQETRQGPGAPGREYPNLSLFGHALPREGPLGWLRRRWVDRPVCSQVACHEWQRIGAEFFAWSPFSDEDDYAVIDVERDGISPGEIAENARRGRLITIGERPYGVAGLP